MDHRGRGGFLPQEDFQDHQDRGEAPFSTLEVRAGWLQPLPSWYQQIQRIPWNTCLLALWFTRNRGTLIYEEVESVVTFLMQCSGVGKSDIIAKLTLGWWSQFQLGGFAEKAWRCYDTDSLYLLCQILPPQRNPSDIITFSYPQKTSYVARRIFLSHHAS